MKRMPSFLRLPNVGNREQPLAGDERWHAKQPLKIADGDKVTIISYFKQKLPCCERHVLMTQLRVMSLN